MNNVNHPKLMSSQKSVSYFIGDYSKNDPILKTIPNYYQISYPNMLIDDVRMGIIKASTLNNSFKAFIEHSDPKIEKLVAHALSSDRYYEQDLSKSIYSFFGECAANIMGFGQANYEIVYLSDSNYENISNFQLKYIPPKTMVWKKDRLFQYIPLELSRALNKPQYIELSSENILIFKPPKYLENILENIMVQLAYLSKPPTVLEFIFQKDIPYDVNEHIRTEKLGVAEAGKIIGWNARFSFQEYVTEYYDLYRFLKFEKFKIDLRNKILKTLNEGISCAGKKMGFSAQLNIEGLPSLEDVETMKKHLKSGSKPFNEIVKAF